MSDVLLKHSRMPKKYDPKPPAEKTRVSHYGNLTGVDPQEVLKRYLSDESTKDIAATYDVTRQALGRYLLQNAEEDWKEAQVARAIARKEAAEDAMEVAQDPLSLARARELFKAATWDLERVCRRIYGEDRVNETPVTPILNITIAGDQKEPAQVSISLARVSVQPQQYDSGAPHNGVITDAVLVDNSKDSQ